MLLHKKLSLDQYSLTFELWASSKCAEKFGPYILGREIMKVFWFKLVNIAFLSPISKHSRFKYAIEFFCKASKVENHWSRGSLSEQHTWQGKFWCVSSSSGKLILWPSLNMINSVKYTSYNDNINDRYYALFGYNMMRNIITLLEW